MGFPVAVKLASTSITHKTDVGGVVLDVRVPEASVARAYDTIRERLAKTSAARTRCRASPSSR